MAIHRELELLAPSWWLRAREGMNLYIYVYTHTNILFYFILLIYTVQLLKKKQIADISD